MGKIDELKSQRTRQVELMDSWKRQKVQVLGWIETYEATIAETDKKIAALEAAESKPMVITKAMATRLGYPCLDSALDGFKRAGIDAIAADE